MPRKSEITVADLFGRAVTELRKERGQQQKQAVPDLRDYGITLHHSTMVELEKGRRESIPFEWIIAFADYFNVPVWRLFAPSPEYADAVLYLGRHTVPAWSIVADILEPATIGLRPDIYATELAAGIARQRGETEAVKNLYNAISGSRRL